jgi:hypothetical protein
MVIFMIYQFVTGSELLTGVSLAQHGTKPQEIGVWELIDATQDFFSTLQPVLVLKPVTTLVYHVQLMDLVPLDFILIRKSAVVQQKKIIHANLALGLVIVLLVSIMTQHLVTVPPIQILHVRNVPLQVIVWLGFFTIALHVLGTPQVTVVARSVQHHVHQEITI